MEIFTAESGGVFKGWLNPNDMNIYLASNDNWSKYILNSYEYFKKQGEDMNIFLAGGYGELSHLQNNLNKINQGKQMDLYLVTSSGGTGNPQICKDKIDMDIYLAGTEERSKQMVKDCEDYCTSTKLENSAIEKSGYEGNLFSGTNILQSFYYCNDFTEKVIIPSCENFMLDSGAFTFFSSGKNVDWNEYIKKYAEFINRNNIKLFFELDIDVLIGYENVLKLRKRLETLTNKKCIPVWHKSRGLDEFIKMCKEYDYVAIGGIVSKEITSKEYKYFPKLIKIAHENGAKIHGLGFTNLAGLTKYHFDSVDSTSWVSGNRFGAVYKFNGKTMVKYAKKEGQRLADSRKVAVHNFIEWKKFANYAKTNL